MAPPLLKMLLPEQIGARPDQLEAIEDLVTEA
jgi:hypothetical protein